MKTKHAYIHAHCTCVWPNESQAVSSSCVSPTNNSPYFCWSSRASPLRAHLYGNSSVVVLINSYH